jgi:MFS family permease
VPTPIRARCFAPRTRLAQLSLFAAHNGGGLALEWGRERGAELALCGALFTVALGARLVSSRYLARQSEAPGLADRHRTLSPGEVIAAIRSARSGRILLYLVVMQAAVHVAAPYFTPYMLGPLALTYTGFMVLTAAAFLARVAVLPLLGRLAHARGTRVVLGCGALGIAPLPVLWLVSDSFVYLLFLQLWSGSAWAALEFATMLSFFEGIDEGDRASVLSAYNLATAAAIALGALVGAGLFASMEGGREAYALLFVLSVACRLGALLLLRGTDVARHVLDLRFRTLAVRPSAGAVERPILATVADEDATHRA